MKSLIKYINEALFNSASEFIKADTYEYFPKNHYELVKLVNDLIYDKKIEELNKINVSDIIDFSSVFSGFINNFNCGIIDLTNWDVSNAETMERMFYNCSLNFNISNWNVSSVTDMKEMFSTSAFNGDISKWDVSSVKNMTEMFAYSKFNRDISNWNVSSVTSMENMFLSSNFNKDISKWKVGNVVSMYQMFALNKFFNIDLSEWDVSNVNDFDFMFYDTNYNHNLEEWKNKIKSSASFKEIFSMTPIEKNNLFPSWIDLD